MPQFTYLTLTQARAALAARLRDTSMVFWLSAELTAYLAEALRTWNALTNTWTQEYVFSVTAPASQIWYPLYSKAGYVRQRTVTDAYLYTVMEYQLLEPATGGTWTGTSQFTISDLSAALQRRRDEFIQYSSCNLVALAEPTTPNTRRIFLQDTVLETRRARFVPAPPFGNPVTLSRDDEMAFEYFEAGYLQNQNQYDVAAPQPNAYSLISGPPLALDVDITPQVPGYYDVIALQSGANFVPPAATLLGIPDDYSWVLKWGAMADLLMQDSDARDTFRGQYCLQRYQDGLKLATKAPWVSLAQMNGVPVDTSSVDEMDAYATEWDSKSSAPQCIVDAGPDFVALSPVPTSGNPVSVELSVIANAPVPVADGDYVQVSRDVLDVILDYAQHLASFKQGGAEFMMTRDLAKNFVMAAQATNARVANLGIFRDLLLGQGARQDSMQPRFENVNG